MKKFLEYVAEDILNKYNCELKDIVVVFPNKRASLFLNKYLYGLIGHPFWSPQYITISELFRQQSSLTVADPIKANCIMHKAYCECTGSTETLDEFWGWGQMILADFDDLDKNMADAEVVFSNVSDIHALDSVSYLTPEQREAIRSFFSQFSDDEDSKLKQRFITLWEKLHDIYTTVNKLMTDEGLAYEGALYREVAMRADSLEWKQKHYLFVGFNMMQECEQKLMMSMKQQGLAHFYWDFDRYYLDNPQQEAGTFINQYLVRFPNELDIKDEDIYCNMSKQKDVTYLSASTENIQARYITDWLRSNNRIGAGENTAIVLADETLLKNVIHYLPDELSGNVNITLGYPLSQSPAATLVSMILDLHSTSQKTASTYTAKPVLALLRHPYMRHISERATDIITKMHDEHIYFPEVNDLCADENLALVFSPFEGNLNEKNAEMVRRLSVLFKIIGQNSEAERCEELAYNGINPEDVSLSYEEQFMQESVFQMSKVLTRIGDLIAEGTLTVAPHTLHRLIDQIIQGTTMPFHGEPAVGVQVMGVLETRNLDFDHVLMLSCNEGNLPKGINDTSLIPYFIRKAHKLTTIDKKEAIFAYYFYRLMQRATDVSLTYNNSTDETHTGQMSRFMLQMMVENAGMKLNTKSLSATQMPTNNPLESIEKDEQTMKVLKEMTKLAPTSIGKYLRCPKIFFYEVIAKVKQPKAESIEDNRAFGNIFHNAAEMLYKNIMGDGGIISKEVLKSIKDEKGHVTIKRFVDEAFSAELFNKRKPMYDGLQLISREVIVKMILNLVEADYNLAPFTILELEREHVKFVDINVDGEKHSINIGGKIDRLDRITGTDGKQVTRVVDYKTGSKIKTPPVLEDIFVKDGKAEHADYYLQAMLYAITVDNEQDGAQKIPTRPALLFIRSKESTKDPVLQLARMVKDEKDKDQREVFPINDIAEQENEFTKGLTNLLEEIFNPEVPFIPTTDENKCKKCNFAKLCKG